MHKQMVRTPFPVFIRLAALTLMLGIFWIGATAALAQGPSFGLRPQTTGVSYFEFTLAPGETVQDVLVANNPHEVPLPLKVWTARGMTMAAGGITFAGDANGPAQWITMPDAGSVIVPPTETLHLPFAVTVPDGTPPGEYIAGFLATLDEEAVADDAPPAEDAAEGESGFRVKVVSQVGVTVVITVPEANRCEAVITSLTSDSDRGRWRFLIGMQNTGNVHFRATGEIIARAAGSDAPLLQSPFSVDYFIPGDAIEYPLSLEPYPAAGDYDIEVNLLTDCGAVAAFNQPISISPAHVEQAAAQVPQTEAQQTAAGDAARVLAQAELIRSIALLLGVLSAVVIAGVVVVIVMRRRKSLPRPALR